MKIYSLILQFFLMLFPWRIRKIMLNSFLKMKIDKGAKIGFSIILAKRVHLLQDSVIGNFNFINRIDLLEFRPPQMPPSHLTDLSKLTANRFGPSPEVRFQQPVSLLQLTATQLGITTPRCLRFRPEQPTVVH